MKLLRVVRGGKKWLLHCSQAKPVRFQKHLLVKMEDKRTDIWCKSAESSEPTRISGVTSELHYHNQDQNLAYTDWDKHFQQQPSL